MTSQVPSWRFDETSGAGVDYQSVDEARRYDEMHQRFRDYRKGAEDILDRLALGSESVVIDLGAGTGAFALRAAETCKMVYAVDVSPAMLAVCREKAEKAGLTNIVCRVGGFLTYEHPEGPADAMVSVAALHHLPDFWKQSALRRCAGLLKPGGRFYLFDIVFPSEADDLEGRIDRWIETIREKAGPELAAEAEVHVRSEYSAFDWVMDGLLDRAGFDIESVDRGEGFQTAYVCVRR